MDTNLSRLFTGFQTEKRFLFIRHGESRGNVDNIIQGRKNFRLTDKGRSQAKATGEWLKQIPAQSVFSSPLSRALETAQIASHTAWGLDPEPWEELTELDTGIFSGLSVQEIQSKYPEQWKSFKENSWDTVKEAENRESLYERCLQSWKKLAENAAAGADTQVCFTHAGTLKWIIYVSFGVRAWFPLVPTSNCGIYVLKVEPSKAERQTTPISKWMLMDFQAPGIQTTPEV
ncbi:MAG: histidine phosphatase family protein [Spirochaetia bacterium]